MQCYVYHVLCSFCVLLGCEVKLTQFRPLLNPSQALYLQLFLGSGIDHTIQSCYIH